MELVTVYLSLGSNVGDRQRYLEWAIEYIEKIAEGAVQKSHLYETAPVGPQDQGYFYNQVVCLQTRYSKDRLLYFLKGVEIIIGRKQRSHWGAREIDCDILYYGEEVYSNAYVSIPHREIAQRLFVLVPLCDIDANYCDPLHKKSVGELLQERLKIEGGHLIRRVER